MSENADPNENFNLSCKHIVHLKRSIYLNERSNLTKENIVIPMDNTRIVEFN